MLASVFFITLLNPLLLSESALVIWHLPYHHLSEQAHGTAWAGAVQATG